MLNAPLRTVCADEEQGSANKCSLCFANYDLTADGNCVLNQTSLELYPVGSTEISNKLFSLECEVDNCITCSSQDVCDWCDEGYEIKNGNARRFAM